MATLFRNLFRSKKGSNSKEESPERRDVQRGVDERRSFRAGTSRSRGRSARFADDDMLPATAAYHTNTTTKRIKGPQSCPGGYRDDEVMSTRSYKESSSRRYENQPRSSRFPEQFHRRNGRDTSEYGSGDPSPIGNINARHSHYDPQLDESEHDEMEEYQFQEMKNAYRHYYQKFKESEIKRKEEKKRFKDFEKEKEDMQKVLFQQIEILSKGKDRYKRKVQQLETELHQLRMTQMQQQQQQSSYQFMMTPQMMPPPMGPPSHQHHHHQRLSFMATPINPISSTNTPTTSAMDSTGGGAGESLVPASDLSMLQLQSMPPLRMDLSLNGSSGLGGLSSAPFASSAFEDEADETKNFRLMDQPLLEAPRGSNLDVASPLSSRHGSTVILAERVNRDEGYNTTTPDEALRLLTYSAASTLTPIKRNNSTNSI